MEKRYFLGLDNGGTMTKAAILDMERGGIVATAARKTAMIMPAPGRTEKNLDDVWQANLDMIRKVLADAGLSGGDIAGIALTGTGNGLYLADADGRQTHNGIVSTDTRADKYAVQCRESGRHRINLPKTMQSIWGGQPPMLLQWLRDNEPEVLHRTRHVFLLKDLLRFRLTGEAFLEKTEMSGAHLLNQRTALPDREILRNFDLLDLEDKFPPLRDSSDCCGTVTAAAASASGLRAGTPVYGGTMDITACAIASGVVDESLDSAIGGTWSINQYISRTPVIEPELSMDSLYCIPGWHLVCDASPTGAGNLEWFLGAMLADRAERCAADGTSIYDYCEAMLNQAGPDSPVVFVPFVFSNHVNRAGSACFLGLRALHGQAHMIRAVYEGVCFSHRYHFERLRGFGDKADTIRLTGGAAKSAVWLQMFADILGRPVETVYGEELGILGTLMTALVGSGACRDYTEAVERLVKVKERIEPDHSLKTHYDEKYERYKRAVESGLLTA
ncbi:MAG: carbohydrate kinase [Planctomycetaceae bacterium]|nr:carbohydrate kinase [Planctomycetaceae bacterium]